MFKGVRGLMFIHPRPKVICNKDNWSGDSVSIAESVALGAEKPTSASHIEQHSTYSMMYMYIKCSLL